ncbi:MAG: ATP-binding cassette domain-containing protein [Propionibacteriaceae bacterium]|nr:ATP-binding cassette domain-containing protein [Propionibacteriaceae bacterium]
MGDNTMNNHTLDVCDLAKSYGERSLWSGVSFTLRPGQIMALRGNSGSGKSTLLNAVGMLTGVDAGTITYAGKELRRSGWGARKTRVETVSFLFQDYALVEDATVAENLDIAGRPRAFSKARDYSDILARFGLQGRENSMVYVLSGGEQQRLSLARLCVRPTPIILADEPTAALDDTNTNIVLDALTTLAHEGRIILIATHSDHVAAIADTTLWLHHNGHTITSTGEQNAAALDTAAP